ncbi:hypothetical protein AB0F17_27070 [Nonomuraea sp. NPDC026600]|uniref:hypothetical protein n=1 Tax=Nonomuraea sp. NPDC026600 TaxID=3155363 RepID=UPI0033F82220
MVVVTLAVLKVEQEYADLADIGAHQLKMAKKDFVAEAIKAYLEIRREEIRQNMLATMAKLDGSARSEISLLTGLSADRIDELGGVREER